ncbi:MAG: helix-turn-helix domain-containing protein, partial [Proteobacteria bacterium]|nr:helix-turn-helix domain-containing protein [Pseudomonadota bacterium]
ELATLAGIGKSTLSVLEAGKGNPNIETIWAIADALKVPFGQLIDNSAMDTRLIKKGEGTLIDTGDKAICAKLLVSRSRRGAFELFQLDLNKGACRKADAHSKGTVEHILVQKGVLITGPIENPTKLQVGDLVSFPADVPHVYEAPLGAAAALVMMDYH